MSIPTSDASVILKAMYDLKKRGIEPDCIEVPPSKMGLFAFGVSENGLVRTLFGLRIELNADISEVRVGGRRRTGKYECVPRTWEAING